MKKGNFTAFNQEYKGFIIIEDMSDLIDYFNERLRGMQKDSATELVKRAKLRASNQSVNHTTDVITHATEIITEQKGRGCLYNQATIMAELELSLIKNVEAGNRIAINPFNGVSNFTIPNTTVINFIEVAKYTVDNIRVSRWPDGFHWYAKVGYIDVVIDGEQKWDARWVAQQKAEEFLLSLNK